MDVIDRCRSVGRGATLRQQMMVRPAAGGPGYTRSHGDDIPEVRDWVAGGARPPLGAGVETPWEDRPTGGDNEQPPDQGTTPTGVLGSEPLLAGVRVPGHLFSDGGADAVTRLLADLGADVLKLEPPEGSPACTERPTLDGVRSRSRCTTPTSAAPCSIRRMRRTAGVVLRTGRPVRHRRRQRECPRPGGDYGTSCADLADRYPHLVTMSVTRPAVAVRGRPHRPGALRDVHRAVPVRGHRRSGAAARRHRLGDRGGPGGVGRAGGLLQPVALRCRRCRLLQVRRHRAGARPAVRDPGPGRDRTQPGRLVAGPAQPGRPSRTPGSSGAATVTSASVCFAAAVARAAGLAGGPAQFQDPAFDTIAARGLSGARSPTCWPPQTMERLVADGRANIGCRHARGC